MLSFISFLLLLSNIIIKIQGYKEFKEVYIMDVKEIANKLIEKLNKYKEFKGLYIYGSRVYGNPRPDSDLDVIAVFEKKLDRNLSHKISGEILGIEAENDIFIDIFKMTEEELNLNHLFFDEVKRGLYYAGR